MRTLRETWDTIIRHRSDTSKVRLTLSEMVIGIHTTMPRIKRALQRGASLMSTCRCFGSNLRCPRPMTTTLIGPSQSVTIYPASCRS